MARSIYYDYLLITLTELLIRRILRLFSMFFRGQRDQSDRVFDSDERSTPRAQLYMPGSRGNYRLLNLTSSLPEALSSEKFV